MGDEERMGDEEKRMEVKEERVEVEGRMEVGVEMEVEAEMEMEDGERVGSEEWQDKIFVEESDVPERRLVYSDPI